MNREEDFRQDRDQFYLTDDEENQAEMGCPTEDGEDGEESSDLGFSRNQSDYATEVPSPAWPQSYRKSVDLLTGMTPPNMSYLKGSGGISSLFRRNQSSNLDLSSSLEKPLISDTILNKERVIGSTISNKSNSQLKLSISDLPPPQENLCSVSQSILNGTNILCGIGLLTTPYALKEGGWLGLLMLLFYGVIACYTGILMKKCLESSPGLHTYPDIGQAAFGVTGRLTISILLYVELYAALVEFIIMMSDNLLRLFPNYYFNISGIPVDSHITFAIISTIIILPTVWVRDLSLLSYLSVGGVISTALVAICLFWIGVVDGVGFHSGGKAIDLPNLSVAIGIYGFCFSGHAVFPNIYSSMKEPAKFPFVLIISFTFCIFLYTGVAACGYLMFGDLVESQITLNMPKHFAASKIAVWTAVVVPLSKYALAVTPIVLGLEELMPSPKLRSYSASIVFRTAIVISTLVVAVTVPFFAIVMALIGSFLAMLVAIIIPCICYMSIMRGRLTELQIGICIFVIAVGLVSACCGTYSAIARLAAELA